MMDNWMIEKKGTSERHWERQRGSEHYQEEKENNEH